MESDYTPLNRGVWAFYVLFEKAKYRLFTACALTFKIKSNAMVHGLYP